MAILIAALLTFSMTASMTLIPNANAHTPPLKIPTYSFISASPNPAGVNQTVYVNYWIDKVPPTAEGIWGYRWHNMMVTVTKPDGTTAIVYTANSDAAGGTWGSYVPDEVGNYTFVGTFPDQIVTVENPTPYPKLYYPYTTNNIGMMNINDTYTASSAKMTLNVQEKPIYTAYPSTPLPTQYWTTPINSMNTEWYNISGNWLGLGVPPSSYNGAYSSNGNFDPYTTAPNSAHILWTKPLAFGGQIGGAFNDSETGVYATGSPYESKFGAVIIDGVLYYTESPGAANDIGPLTAVNLHTGETLWTVQANATLRGGMVYNFITGDQYGAHAYLFTAPPANYGSVLPLPPTNLWSMYDAMTGQWILNIANVTAGTLVTGPNGELLSYRVAGGMLSLWNASKCIAAASQKYNTYYQYSSQEIWRPPPGATIDWKGGYEWSVPVASKSASGAPISLGLVKVDTSDGVALLDCSPPLPPPGGSQTGWRIDAGYSTIDGHLLWGPLNRTLTPYTNVIISYASAGEGVYVEYTNQFETWTGYSILTGAKLWGPTVPYNNPWGYYDWYDKGVIGYGNLYTWSMDGHVYCYDVKTGTEKWNWTAGNAGADTPYGTWPLGTRPYEYILADGKIYVDAGHDYTPPLFKGAQIYCLNATTGELIWSSLSFNVEASPAIADGIMLWDNAYDTQLYAYGMGPSATTVTAPDVGVTTATPVTITGSVMDISAGSQQNAVAMNFPHGLPCVSDASMSQWMEYVYEQQPMPTNATGVQVTLTAIDPNHNFITLGTATTDTSGNYGFIWTPPQIPGTYHITATFNGTNSYYSSSDTTYMNVQASATPAPTATPITGLATMSALTYGIVAVIIVIIIAIAIVGLLLLRKKP